MFKKLNFIIGLTLAIILVLLPFQYFNLLKLPEICNYWSVLIILLGFLNFVKKKKSSLENLSLMFIGLALLLNKLSSLIY